MSNLLVHQEASIQLAHYSKHLPQALLLTGSYGVGLHTIAQSIARNYKLQAELRPELLTKTSSIPQIGVERVRELYVLSRGKQATTSVIIIDNADAMTESAQNSFLKLLEEPPENIHFLLTTHSPEMLLPTIASRLQTFYIKPISDKQSQVLVSKMTGLDDTKRRQMLFIASGLPAELERLSRDEKYFQIRSSRIRFAKELAEGTTAQRLVAAIRSSLARDEAIAAIKQLIKLLEMNPQPASISRIKKLLDALDSIEKGGNIRLQLISAVL